MIGHLTYESRAAMGRLILILLMLIALMLSAGRLIDGLLHTAREDDVPKTAKTISYVLLIVLMFGVVTGRLGGL